MPTDIRALKKDGDQYYPQTHAKAIVGLDDEVQDIVNSEVFDGIRIASANGTVFIWTVSDDGQVIVTQEEPEEES